MAGPSFEVFTMTPYGDNKVRWARVGAAFTNRDGSVNVQLDAVPVNGKLQLRVPRPRTTGEPPRDDVPGFA